MSLEFPKMTKQEFSEKIKNLTDQKTLATKKMKNYRAAVTNLKYQLAQLKLQKKQIIISDKDNLKNQTALF